MDALYPVPITIFMLSLLPDCAALLQVPKNIHPVAPPVSGSAYTEDCDVLPLSKVAVAALPVQDAEENLDS